MKHDLIIKAGIAACTCRRWNGPAQGDTEQQGAFTLRAHSLHLQHKENALQPVQDSFLTQ